MFQDSAILFPGASLYRSFQYRDQGVVHAPHSWKLVIPVEGRLALTWQGSRREVPAGKALLVRADARHVLVGGPQKVVFFVEPEIYRGFVPQWSEPVLIDGATGLRLHDFGKDVAHMRAEDSSTLQSILATAIELAAHGRDSPGRPLHARVEDALQWFRRPWLKLDHKQIAKRSGIAPSYLSHLLKEQLGISGKRYALWVRTVYAIQQLSQGARAKDIAKQMGFHDLAHFSRSARSFLGTPPSSMPSVISVIDGGLYGSCAEPADESTFPYPLALGDSQVRGGTVLTAP